MTPLAITSTMVEDWAVFSNDRNPLHSDEGVARRFAQSLPFAHGMLAMMPLKLGCSEAVLTTAKQGVRFRFDALMRAPVPIDVPLQVASDSDGSRHRFVLSRLGDAGCLIQSTARMMTAPEPATLAVADHVAASPEIVMAHEDFRQRFTKASSPWIFLEAFVFGELVRKYFPGGHLRLARGPFAEATRRLGADWITLHVRHTATVCPHLVGPDPTWRPPAGEVRYGIAVRETHRDQRQIALSVDVSISISGAACILVCMRFRLLQTGQMRRAA